MSIGCKLSLFKKSTPRILLAIHKNFTSSILTSSTTSVPHFQSSPSPSSSPSSSSSSLSSPSAEAFSSSSSLPLSAIPLNNNNNNNNNNTKKKKKYWWCLKGFFKFSARRDIELVLDNISPISIDALLDDDYLPTGDWVLQFNTKTMADKLQLHLQSSVALQSRGITLSPLLDKDIQTVTTVSKMDISNKTVLIRNVHNDVGEEGLRYFLQDYKFDIEKDDKNKSIKVLSNKYLSNNKNKQSSYRDFGFDKKRQFSNYLINFSTPEEASRAVREKNLGVLEGSAIKMFWYQV